jgi:hypothetical protein
VKLMAAAGWGGEVSRGRGDRWTACLLVCRPGFLMLPWNGRSAGPRAFVGKYRRHGRPLLRMIAAKLIRHYCIVTSFDVSFNREILTDVSPPVHMHAGRTSFAA